MKNLTFIHLFILFIEERDHLNERYKFKYTLMLMLIISNEYLNYNIILGNHFNLSTRNLNMLLSYSPKQENDQMYILGDENNLTVANKKGFIATFLHNNMQRQA